VGCQFLDLLAVELGPGQPVDERPHAGIDGESGLVTAVVGIAPEKMLESGPVFVKTLAEIHLSHRELILIGEEHVPGKTLHRAI
jgi:hypothetical protein